MTVRVLALDLEATLISDSRSAEPRPGLLDFLEFCQERFERVVLFTRVERDDAFQILERLARLGHVPRALLDRLEYVEWSGEYKDLGFIPDASPDEVLFVDDEPGWIRPDQRDRWVVIAAWHGGADADLNRVRAVLERAGRTGASP